MRPVAILLAAGTGSRWDASGRESKLLAAAPRGAFRGAPLAVAAARNLLAALPRVFAVVRPGDDDTLRRLRAELAAAGCELVECPEASGGMGASLACGARAVMRHLPATTPEAAQSANDPTRCGAGVLVALADMPAIDPTTIDAVAGALEGGHATAAPVVNGRRGHPVGFAAHLLPELARLRGDQGARALLQRFPPHPVPTGDDGALFDIDTRSDAG